MEDDKPMTRDELREKYPEYDNMSAIEKITLEDRENTAAGKTRRNAARGLEYVTAAAGPLVTYWLGQRSGNDPSAMQYALSVLMGYGIGFGLRIAVSTMVHEIVDPEGEVGRYIHRYLRRKD